MRNLRIHFLNVGHGDCTIIDFPDRLTMVDINNCKKLASETEKELRDRYRDRYRKGKLYRSLAGIPGGDSKASTPVPGMSSAASNLYNAFMEAEQEKRELDRQISGDVDRLTDPIDYLKRNFPGRPIFRYIQTHPDMDHMAGLFRLVHVEKIPIWNFWDTAHSIEKEESAKKWQNVNFDIRDWHTYQQLRRGAADPKVLRLAFGAKDHYYQDDGISIWAPFDTEDQDNPDADPNAFSYVLHIQLGECSIVLGGDLSAEKWAKLKNFPKVNLLKPSHHGRKSGYDRDAVKAMSPDVSVVSVGELKGKDDASASYERFSTRGCYSTVDHGDIIATCWENGVVMLNTIGGKRIDPPAAPNLALYSALLGMQRRP